MYITTPAVRVLHQQLMISLSNVVESGGVFTDLVDSVAQTIDKYLAEHNASPEIPSNSSPDR